MSRKHKSRKVRSEERESALRQEGARDDLLDDLEWDRLDESATGPSLNRVDRFHADFDRIADSPIGSESEWEALLDTELGNLDVAAFTADVPPAEMERDQGLPDESSANRPAFVCRQNTLANTIKNHTGWGIAGVQEGESDLLCPVFTDGEKYYRFITWRIIITFRDFPGMRLLRWSPETLEADLDRAMETQVTKEQDLKSLAQALRSSFTSEELRSIWEMLHDRLRGV